VIPLGDTVRFAFVCEVDPRDASALVSLSVTPPERLLSSNVLHVLARPEGGLENVYRVASYGAPHPIVDPEAAEEDFVDLLNAVRRLAGLTPVALDPGQSETASELAPAFFASIFGRAPEYNAEMVILGMLAGWSVDGIVQSGHFTASWVLRSNDLQRLLAAALEEPGGRETLLAAEIDRIALGALLETVEGRESMAAIFGSYALFSEEDHAASVNAVMEKLGHERALRGLGPARSIDEVAPLCSGAASRVASGETPRDVMRDLLGETVEIRDRERLFPLGRRRRLSDSAGLCREPLSDSGHRCRCRLPSGERVCVAATDRVTGPGHGPGPGLLFDSVDTAREIVDPVRRDPVESGSVEPCGTEPDESPAELVDVEPVRQPGS